MRFLGYFRHRALRAGGWAAAAANGPPAPSCAFPAAVRYIDNFSTGTRGSLSVECVPLAAPRPSRARTGSGPESGTRLTVTTLSTGS